MFFCIQSFSQKLVADSLFTKIDSLYREDQIYVSFTYNKLTKTPSSMESNGIPFGISTGFIRDFPINKNRTYAVGIGLGIAYNKYHTNLVAAEDSTYSIAIDYDKNKFEQVSLDLPIEFRYRTSTPTRYDFFRCYFGFKFSYMFFNKTKFISSTKTIRTLQNGNFNQFQFGPNLSIGYNTWNLHLYYGLNPIFKSGYLNDEKLMIKNINIGLIFYIL